MEEEEKIENGIYGGRRTYEYILIPETGGILEVPSIRFAYFDPAVEEYVTLESDPIFVHSAGEIDSEEPTSYGLSRKDIEAVGSDIRYIKSDVEALGDSSALYDSVLFWSLQASMPFALIGLILLQRHRDRIQGDIAYARRRRARSEAGKRLEQAGRLLEEGNSGAFYGEIHRAV